MRYRDTWHHAPETAGTALAAMDGESTMLEWDDAPGYSPDPPEHDDKHEHTWGPVEYARLTGNPHRKCQVVGCWMVSLDLDDDD